MREALLYEKLEKDAVRCLACNHYCQISDGKLGFCGVRKNEKGMLFSLVWGRPVAMHIDPIEKKPFFHFLPGSKSFSIATIGCNFRCGFCQNWQISQVRFQEDTSLKDEGLVMPEQVVKEAVSQGCKSISYTYTEPTVFFEYALDIAREAKEVGLSNNFVTNGFMSKECLQLLAPYLDAANVDLKFFSDSSYRQVCAGSLNPVLSSIKLMKQMGIWVEVTTLVVPGENDSQQELAQIADFIASVDKDMPWHISRFHPDFQFGDKAPTPFSSLRLAESVGKKAGLNYIYLGNVLGEGAVTFCPNCHKPLIRREGFTVLEYHLKGNCCSYCQSIIPGVF